MRTIVYSAIYAYVSYLDDKKSADFEKIAQIVCRAAENAHSPKIPYRALLVDEVQDLTQMEMSIISLVHLTTGTTVNVTENSLFLAGDGAQAIFNRGFSFKKAGIDIANRSSLLKRSYRNTFEILRAAYALIEGHQFSDSDEDDMGRPSEPHLSAQRGLPPKIVQCSDIRAESWFIAQSINVFIRSGVTPGQICILGPTKLREAVAQQLNRFKISVVELKDDVDFASPDVKASTIESAKGHEFAVVYICGMNKGFLPTDRSSGNEISKDAAKLYVAMTRARNSLFLTYSSNSQTNMPSPFLLTIQAHCDEFDWKESGLVPIRE
jgi:superfamily I DNA/RNA helicase